MMTVVAAEVTGQKCLTFEVPQLTADKKLETIKMDKKIPSHTHSPKHWGIDGHYWSPPR
jgi:hypothetical protein